MICQDSYTYTQLEAPEVVLSNKGGSRIVANAFSRFLLGYWAAKTAYIRSTKRYFADVRTKLFSGAESCQISHLFCQWKINVTPWYACVGTEEGGRRYDSIQSQPDARTEWVFSTTLSPFHPPGNILYPFCRWWVRLGTNLDRTENLASTRIRSPARPARSELCTGYAFNQ